MWLAAIIVAAALMFVVAVVECILLNITFTTAGAHALIIASFVLGAILLVVSITEWCEHGSLLTSTVVLAYVMWLCYEGLSMLPLENGGELELLPGWIGLCVCGFSLIAFAFCASSIMPKSAAQSAEGQEAMEQGDAPESVQAGDDDTSSQLNLREFTVQCLVHAAAALYICSSLAPAKSLWTFVARVMAVALSLVLYGWSLVAPKVLKNREF